MRTSRLLARIEALEALFKPNGRLFVFADFDGDAASFEGRLASFRAEFDGDPATYEERLAAFSVEHGVGPRDEVLSVRITYDADPAEQK